MSWSCNRMGTASFVRTADGITLGSMSSHRRRVLHFLCIFFWTWAIIALLLGLGLTWLTGQPLLLGHGLFAAIFASVAALITTVVMRRIPKAIAFIIENQSKSLRLIQDKNAVDHAIDSVRIVPLHFKAPRGSFKLPTDGLGILVGNSLGLIAVGSSRDADHLKRELSDNFGIIIGDPFIITTNFAGTALDQQGFVLI